MSLHNTPAGWGTLSRTLHWVMALLLCAQVPIGFRMSELYDAAEKDPALKPDLMAAANWHNTIGFLVLALVLLRLSWRIRSPGPKVPAALAAYERGLAHLTHYGLYAVMIAAPLTGWIALSAYGEFPIFFFGWDSVPGIVPVQPLRAEFGFLFFRAIHDWLWKVGAALFALHVLGAVWHWLVKDDGVWERMVLGPRE